MEWKRAAMPKSKHYTIRIKELLDSDRIRQIRSKNDEDARFGHKTSTSTFFGYKTHIAMSDDRIITGIEVTDGSKPDGEQLPNLLEKSKRNGAAVKEIIGPMSVMTIWRFVKNTMQNCTQEPIQL